MFIYSSGGFFFTIISNSVNSLLHLIILSSQMYLLMIQILSGQSLLHITLGTSIYNYFEGIYHQSRTTIQLHDSLQALGKELAALQRDSDVSRIVSLVLQFLSPGAINHSQEREGKTYNARCLSEL